MQANRITASRRNPWRTALDAVRGLFGARRAAAPATDDTAHAGATDAAAAPDLPPAAARSAREAADPSTLQSLPALAAADEAGAYSGAALEVTLGTVDFLAQLDDKLRFQYVSDASIGFIGYHRDYLRTLTLHDLVPLTEADELNALVARAHASGKLESATLSLVKSLTYPICVELRMRSTAPQGVPGFALAAFDVSHWRDSEAKLRHALNHDRLTGLENLTALIPALNAVQAEAEHTRTQAALVLIDIDDYQRINRALGYDAGDDMLRETARRIQHTAGHGERVARVASDEFAVLLPAGTNAESAENLGRRLLTAIAQPYRHRGQHTHLSASVGVALYPDQADPANSAPGTVDAHLLRMADHALTQAKAAGGNTLVFHAPDDDPTDAERLKLEADLYEAVRNGEFSLHFQPITSSQSGGVVGVEALMRWQHPVHGLVPPSTFIPLAESIGLINYLGNWVLKAACMQLVQWDALGIRLEYVSVNVSPQQFRDKRFTFAVQEALALTGLNPRRLVFEITESLLMHDPEEATLLLETLTALGIRFAVDDFGTGYSSLAYLQRFPLSKLKIDRSFVENLLTSRNNRAIVSAVVGLAQSLGLELVAEGVETEAQRDLLTEMGCDHMQGWLISHALPSDELARSFQSNSLYLHEAL
ncbi:diguanylate cyclase/phosphodiesterase (GGDEF & EAL domains) with PAS/PAC sensor(s) [Caballeronia glathei]|jgi:diguanylate cyclase (GGDEF)-like protein|uniref:Diguanylate cyclase n=1 Tax=Caballeronia glathei TaxID=60547 RepID=A0A069PFY6_9BURK|nr:MULTISPECIES: GGDEF domain-containing protein [Burkholderiaceae]KDR38744.1 diguanylate cyclase [Caballeronia glathei]TCK44216.1 diguanylate cyclase (GGDEF)-like protein [Paraburkholderia sp. BL8N3]CDY79550.1 diguanylate cyclase/phosphodiesterase (GGDEF & EAL domains) with PAS/PAC sensor(s) [Caballeronia glathei]